MRRGCTRRIVGRATGVAAVGLVAALALSACSGSGTDLIDPGDAKRSGTPSAPAGATAGLTDTPEPSDQARPCTVTVGSELRERTTTTGNGEVTVLPGTLSCRSVGLWVSDFALDQVSGTDPVPRFVGAYTGEERLTARLPRVGGGCAAAAVFFAVDALREADADRAVEVSAAVRSDLGSWPADRTATVPAASILQGRPSAVLVASVVGDPGTCSPEENVETPFAQVGDCWLAAHEASSSTPSATAVQAAAEGAGFRQTACSGLHTHEVYWAESIEPDQYRQDTGGQEPAASAWARQRATEVCSEQRHVIRYATGVHAADVFLELLWPSGLTYPPGETSDWSKAQIVCLARWADGRTSDRALLRH
jgi:hypothetical protein